MASFTPVSQNGPAEGAPGQGPNYKPALGLLTTLFFMWGFITCLNDILIPHLKALFELTYTRTMLIQFTFFGAYAIMSLPAGWIVGKIGYKNGIVLGLTVTGLGALMFYPASTLISYGVFLTGFFVLASGITILQVAANPYVAILGTSQTASSRLNMTQAFNSLGTTIAPLVGGFLILSGSIFYPFLTDHSPKTTKILNQAVTAATSTNAFAFSQDSARIDITGNTWFFTGAQVQKYDGKDFKTFALVNGSYDTTTKGVLIKLAKIQGHPDTLVVMDAGNFASFRIAEAKAVQMPYIGLAVVLFLIALIFAFAKKILPAIEASSFKKEAGSAWSYRHLVLGAIAIFVYVGGEVSIGSFLINFFKQPDIAGLAPKEGAKYVALYWGGAMIGRFFGAVSLSGIRKNSDRYLLYAGIFMFAFFISWYLTKEIQLAGLFLVFVAINLAAFMLGNKKPNRTLTILAAAVVLLVSVTVLSTGHYAMWSIIAVGLFNSIMFPTIFTLAIDGLGKHTSQGSGILCMAIVGGAIIPLLMGVMADHFGIHHSFLITLVCYLYIMFYGIKGYKHQTE